MSQTRKFWIRVAAAKILDPRRSCEHFGFAPQLRKFWMRAAGANILVPRRRRENLDDPGRPRRGNLLGSVSRTRDGAAGLKILDPRRRPLAETSSRKSCTQRAERPRLTQHFKRIRNEGAAPKILSNPRRSRLMDHSRFAAETRRTENLETLAEEDA